MSAQRKKTNKLHKMLFLYCLFAYIILFIVNIKLALNADIYTTASKIN